MNLRVWMVALGLAAAAGGTGATEVDVSGYATLGYAISDKPYRYQRFISEEGTLRRDSVLGLQLDAKFSPHWGATVQLKAAPDVDSDRGYAASVAWAFVSYRPDNDWLFRVGRQRVPLYLHSANFDVGMTYEFVRLPTEMYSIAQNNDFDSVALTRTWALEGGELSLDMLFGRSKEVVRYWVRDGIPGVQNRGAEFLKFRTEGGIVSVAYRRDENIFRLGYGDVSAKRRDGLPLFKDFPFVSLAPGIGYYQVDSALPGPGIPVTDKVRFQTLTMGMDLDLGSGTRVLAEVARSRVPASELSLQSDRGYIAVLQRMGRWTPYVSAAALRSHAGPLRVYNALDGNVLPPVVPGAAMINAAQRATADIVTAYDQKAFAVGTSYLLSPTQKFKAELMQVRIGDVSKMVDSPPGTTIRRQHIHVLSFSYSMVF